MPRAGSPFLRNFTQVPNNNGQTSSRAASPVEPSKSIEQLIQEKQRQRTQIEAIERLQQAEIGRIEPEMGGSPQQQLIEREKDSSLPMESLRKPVKPHKSPALFDIIAECPKEGKECCCANPNISAPTPETAEISAIEAEEPAPPLVFHSQPPATSCDGAEQPLQEEKSVPGEEMEILRAKVSELEGQLKEEQEQRKKAQFELAKEEEEHQFLRQECMRQVQSLVGMLK